MHVCRTMVCALAKYCSMFHVAPSYIPIWESCTRRYILSVVDPFHRAPRRDGERISPRMASKLLAAIHAHDSIHQSSRLEREKKLWKNRISSAIVSIVDLFHVQPYCFVIAKGDTIPISCLGTCDYCNNVARMLS